MSVVRTTHEPYRASHQPQLNAPQVANEVKTPPHWGARSVKTAVLLIAVIVSALGLFQILGMSQSQTELDTTLTTEGLVLIPGLSQILTVDVQPPSSGEWIVSAMVTQSPMLRPGSAADSCGDADLVLLSHLLPNKPKRAEDLDVSVELGLREESSGCIGAVYDIPVRLTLKEVR